MRIRARDGWLAAIAVAGFVLIAIATHARTVTRPQRLTPIDGRPQQAPPVAEQFHQDQQARHRPHLYSHLHVPWWLLRGLGELGLVILVLGLVLLLVRVVPQFGPRRRAARTDERVLLAPELGPELTERVSATFDRALAGFRRGDREAAIIGCWLRLEEIADSAGYPPGSSETSSELIHRWLSVLPLSAPPLTELGELYREARFSRHRMSDDAVERARRALRQLRADLAGRQPEVAGG